MNWIWSFEKLSKMYHYEKPDPDIFSWIVGRICKLYSGQAGEAALKAIEGSNRDAQWEACAFFKKNPEPRYIEHLEKVFMNSTGEHAGFIAAIFAEVGNTRLIDLFKEKYPGAPHQDIFGYILSFVQVAGLQTVEARSVVETILNDLPGNKAGLFEMAGAVFEANLIAGVPIVTLLNLCNRNPVLHPLYTILLIAIGTVCGLPIEASDLAKIETADGVGLELSELLVGELDYIRTKEREGEGPDKLEELFKGEKYEEVIKEIDRRTRRLIEKKKVEHGEGNYSEWLKGNGMPRRNIEAISAFYTVIDDVPVVSTFSIASAAVYIYSMLLELESLVGRPFSETDIDIELACFLEDRSDVEEDAARVNLLKAAADRGRVIDACFHDLELNRDSASGDRVVEFLCGVGVVDRDVFGRLLSIVEDSPYLWGSIVPALRELGADVLNILPPLFEGLERGDWRLEYLLEILGELPVEKSVQVILENWEHLWVQNKYTLLRNIRNLGDRRFLAPLGSELKEGELYDGDVYSFLCRLNGEHDSVLKRIAKEGEMWRKRVGQRVKYLENKDIRAFLREPLLVEWVCNKCRRSYHYEVHKVFFSYEPAEVLIKDTLRCKHCGVVDNYEYDSYFIELVFQLGLYIADIENLKPEDLVDFVVEPVESPLAERKKKGGKEEGKRKNEKGKS